MSEEQPPVLIDGLTEQEWAYLKTPLVELSPDDKKIAGMVHDKRAEYNYAGNEKYRRTKKEKEDAEKAETLAAKKERLASTPPPEVKEQFENKFIGELVEAHQKIVDHCTSAIAARTSCLTGLKEQAAAEKRGIAELMLKKETYESALSKLRA